MGRPRIFYGWWIVIAGIVIQMMLGGFIMHSFSFYVSAIQDEFPLWTATFFGIAFAVTRVEGSVLGPIQGWLIDRLGPRAMMRFGIAVTAIGLLAFSQLWDQGSFLAFYILLAVGVSVGGFMTLTVATVHWFDKRRSRAIGFMSTGFTFGAFLQPAITWVIDDAGWRTTAIATAIVIFVVGQLLATFIVNWPHEKGMQPDGGEPDEGARLQPGGVTAAPIARHRDFTVKETLRTRAFWGLALAHGAPLLVVSAVFVHFSLRVESIEGLTRGDASTAWAVMAAMQLAGQAGVGYLGDIFSKRLIIGFCMIGHAAAAFLLAFADMYWMVLAFAVFNGVAWGARPALITALRAEYFGTKSYGQVMGWSALVMGIFMTSGSSIVGVLRDATGDFTLGFLVVGIGAALGLIGTLMSTRPRLPGLPAGHPVRLQAARPPRAHSGSLAAQPAFGLARQRPQRPGAAEAPGRAESGGPYTRPLHAEPRAD